MMWIKSKTFIASLFLLLSVNAFFIWGQLGFGWVVFISMILIAWFSGLVVLLLFHIIHLYFEKFKNRSRLGNAIILSVILIFVYYFPTGIYYPVQQQPDTFLSVQHISTANCSTQLWLYPDHRFTHTDICFGKKTRSGSFIIGKELIYMYYDDVPNDTAMLETAMLPGCQYPVALFHPGMNSETSVIMNVCHLDTSKLHLPSSIFQSYTDFTKI